MGCSTIGSAPDSELGGWGFESLHPIQLKENNMEEKKRDFPKYGSIENLYKCKEILEKRVVLTEKLHGTNARLMYDDILDKIRCGGRNQEFDGPGAKHDGYKFWHYVHETLPESVREKLKGYPGWIFYGEFFGNGVQKGVKYRLDNEKEFRVFDIKDNEGKYLSSMQMEIVCDIVGLQKVPTIYSGILTVEKLESLIDMESQTAIENGVHDIKNLAEGVVIKPILPCIDSRGNWMRAKFKSDRWKENASKPKIPKALDPKMQALKEQAVGFADRVVTEGRVHTVVEHITREGNTKIDMSRTPDFLRELVKDVWEEHAQPEDKDAMKIMNKTITNKAMHLWKKYVSENYRA